VLLDAAAHERAIVEHGVTGVFCWMLLHMRGQLLDTAGRCPSSTQKFLLSRGRVMEKIESLIY
jgi:hypothetical protein